MTMLVETTPVRGEPVTFDNAGEPIPAWLALPEGAGPFPAVLVAPAVTGINDYHKQVAANLAENGFAALVVDPYANDPEGPGDLSTPQAAMARVARLSDPKIVSNLSAGRRYLASRREIQADKIGVLGFCMGGAHARLTGSADPAIAAVVDFYGMIRYGQTSETKPDQPIERAAALRCPLIGLYGDADPLVPPAHVAELREVLTGTGQRFSLHGYAEAPHAFHDHTRPNFRAEAARDAWAKAIAFLNETLK